MSARATAKLAFSSIKDYPEVLETASIPKSYFQAGPDEVIQWKTGTGCYQVFAHSIIMRVWMV